MDRDPLLSTNHHPRSSSTAQQAFNVFILVGVVASLVLAILLATGHLGKESKNGNTITNNYYNSNSLNGPKPYFFTNLTSDGEYPILTTTSASSIIGVDGLPVVLVSIDLGIEFYKCFDVNCKSFNKTSTFLTPPNPALYSPVIGRDGLIVFALFHLNYTSFNTLLVIGHCDDVNCTQVSRTTLDTNFTGWFAQVHIAADGYPLVTYMDNQNKSIIVAHCVDYACAKPATINPVYAYSQPINGLASAITLDGNLVLFLTDFYTGNVVSTHCLDLLCTQVGPFVTLGDASNLTVQVYEGALGNLHVVAPGFVYSCLNYECTNVSTATVPFTASGFSVAVDSTGLPVIAVNGYKTGISMIACADENCGSSVLLQNVFPVNQSILDVTVNVGTNGFPMLNAVSSTLTYGDPLEVFVISCSNHLCTPWKN